MGFHYAKTETTTGFHPGFFNWGEGGGGAVQLVTYQILYLITTLGKSLTRPFPGVAIKQRVWSARLGFSRSSMQREREGFWTPAGVGRSRKFGGVGPD